MHSTKVLLGAFHLTESELKPPVFQSEELLKTTLKSSKHHQNYPKFHVFSWYLLVVIPSYAKENTHRKPGTAASCASHTAIQASGEREPWAYVMVNHGKYRKCREILVFIVIMNIYIYII